MTDLWLSLPAFVQDLLWTILLLAPGLAIGSLTLTGYDAWPLAKAILWRFRGTISIFVLLIAVSVGLGIALSAQDRALRHGTAQAADKFDLIVAAPGSELTAMFAAVYLQPSDMGLLSGQVFNEIASHEKVAFAAPLAFGDSFGNAAVVGTTSDFVSYLAEGKIEGRLWATSQEAVLGALVPLEIGDEFEPTHGEGEATEENVHDEEHLTAVGRMAPTGTPWDRAILIPIEAVWEIHGLANGHKIEAGDQIGAPFDAELFPGTPAIVVHPKELWASYALKSEFTRDSETMAFFPGSVLSNLYTVMGDIRQAMSFMAFVTQMLVVASVLLGLFIISRLFQRQIALLRAIGSPTRFIFAVVWTFGAALILAGAIFGIGFGLAFAALLSSIISARTDILIVANLGWSEIHFVAGFVSLALLLNLAPAVKSTSVSIINNLRG